MFSINSKRRRVTISGAANSISEKYKNVVLVFDTLYFEWDKWLKTDSSLINNFACVELLRLVNEQNWFVLVIWNIANVKNWFFFTNGRVYVAYGSISAVNYQRNITCAEFR